LGDGDGGVEANKEVEVVGHAAESEGDALEGAALGLDGGVKGLLDESGDEGQPVPGGPDEMEIELGERGAHGMDYSWGVRGGGRTT
jgi:hypothetical protein